MKQEFKTGDIVHFQPYKERKPIEAKVKETRNFIWDGDRVEYYLSGTDKPLTSITTGKSIVESEYFHPISEKDWLKD